MPKGYALSGREEQNRGCHNKTSAAFLGLSFQLSTNHTPNREAFATKFPLSFVVLYILSFSLCLIATVQETLKVD